MKRHKFLLALTVFTAGCAEALTDASEPSYGSRDADAQAGRGGSGRAGAGAAGGRGGASGGSPAGGSGGTGVAGSAGSSSGSGAAAGTSGVDAGGGSGAGGAGTGGSAGALGSAGMPAGGSAGNPDGGGGTGGTGPATGFAVHYKVEIGGAGSAIGSELRIVNNGTSTVNLNELTVRYYFTNEVTAALIAGINWANIGPLSGATTGLPAGELTIDTVAMPAPTAAADSYAEFGFNAAGKTLAPGSRVQFSWTVQNHGSQSFDQTDDHSFNAALTSAAEWQNVVLLQGSSVLWGVQP